MVSLEILDVACCYLWLFSLYIGMEVCGGGGGGGGSGC